MRLICSCIANSNLGGIIGLQMSFNDILSLKNFKISNIAIYYPSKLYFFQISKLKLPYNGVTFPILRFCSHYVEFIRSCLIIEHFSSFLIDNKRFFKRFLIFFSNFLRNYRVLFRLFRPIISVILIIFFCFIYNI